VVEFPNAKINLGLNVTEKRSDGFHNIETCFYPVSWSDILEIVPSKKAEIEITGTPIPGSPTGNICFKAFQLLRQDFNIPNVAIHLHKLLPIGAGLGGGSSDAAFVVRCLGQMFNLFFEDDLMEYYASLLGSDCAFFIKNKPAIGKGKGDELETIGHVLDGKYIYIIYPNIHVPTAAAYQGVTPQKPAQSIEEVLKMPISDWKTYLKNDFETSVFLTYPVIGDLKNKLYSHGAEYASMSGSGSSVYGIFPSFPESLSLDKEYKSWIGAL